MAVEDNKAFVERYFAAIRKDKSRATLDQFIAEQPLLEHIAGFEAVLPGYWMELLDAVSEGDKVACRFIAHGAHNGAGFMGVPPSGKEVAIDGLIIYQLKDGKIVNHWMQTDMVSFLQQLGALPVPA